MTSQRLAVALLCSAAVSACGGGGGSAPPPTGGGGGTPTPTPTPTFNYTAFDDLTGDQNFPSACVEAEPSPIGTLRQAQPWQFSNSGLVSYTEASDSWTMTAIRNQTEVFGPSDLFSDANGVREYRQPDSGGLPGSRFRLIEELNATNPYSYMRSTFSLLFEPGLASAYTACFIGVPTDPDDIPAATTVTYTDLQFGGFVVDEAPGQTPPSTFSTIVDGTGTITGNTSTGAIDIEFSLTIEDANGVQSTIGPIAGEVTIAFIDEVAGYDGSLNLGGMPEYTIAGGFFGPEGRETGFAFAASLDQNSDGTPERSIFGGVSAQR